MQVPHREPSRRNTEYGAIIGVTQVAMQRQRHPGPYAISFYPGHDGYAYGLQTGNGLGGGIVVSCNSRRRAAKLFELRYVRTRRECRAPRPPKHHKTTLRIGLDLAPPSRHAFPHAESPGIAPGLMVDGQITDISPEIGRASWREKVWPYV